MSIQRHRALENFSALSPSIYLYEPTQATRSHISKDPHLVLICGWLDASPRHISKYATYYANIYPSSRLLVLTTSAGVMLRSSASFTRTLSPALTVLSSLSHDSRVLVHIFSNGGSYTITHLAQRYHAENGHALPITAMVLDSTPGRARYGQVLRAFSVSLPRNIVIRALGVIAIQIVLVIYLLVLKFLRRADDVEKLRRSLNDKKLFGRSSERQGYRLYVYSVDDPMVGYRDVEEHAETAEKSGWIVEKQRYDKTGHAAHMMADPKRYWGAVERLWRDGM